MNKDIHFTTNLSTGTPVDPNPRTRSTKKPPFIIRFNILSNSKKHKLLSNDGLSLYNTHTSINQTLPPIKPMLKSLKARKTRYHSPVFTFNIHKIRPLFEHKKKIDQSMATKSDLFEQSFNTQVNEIPYKIAVTTKKSM
jgi:hypothetical protein